MAPKGKNPVQWRLRRESPWSYSKTTIAFAMSYGQNGSIIDKATPMKVMAAGKAKNGFGLLIDTARAEPVVIEKHGRPVAVILSVEEYERLTGQTPVAPLERRPQETRKNQ